MSSEFNSTGGLNSGDVEIRKANPIASYLPVIVIGVALILSYIVFYNVFGAPENFQGGMEQKEKLEDWQEAKEEWEAENKAVIEEWQKLKVQFDTDITAWKTEYREWNKKNQKNINAYERKLDQFRRDSIEYETEKAEWLNENKEKIKTWDSTKTEPKPVFSKESPKFTESRPGFEKEKPELKQEEPVYPQQEPEHWTDHDPVPPKKGQLIRGYFGVAYKGGFVIPIGMTILLCIFIFSIERFITLSRANGKGSIDVFVKKVRLALGSRDIAGAVANCDEQRGSVANVIRSGLKKYKEVEAERGVSKDQKKLAIQAEIEEATNLELPMLERNLPILATFVAIGVLTGLFGTVIGMIRAFAALSAAGAPDASELATGISEALMNTAIGILNSMLSLIAYNYFTGRIDKMTYGIDEAGYSIIQTYDIEHPEEKAI